MRSLARLRVTFILLGLAPALLVATNPSVKAAEILLYDFANFGGESHVLTQSLADLSDIGFDNDLESFRVDSGTWRIYRDDNSWLFVIGNYQRFFVLAASWLRLMDRASDNSGAPRYRHVEHPTSRGFLLPGEAAERYAAMVVDVAGGAPEVVGRPPPSGPVPEVTKIEGTCRQLLLGFRDAS